MAASVAAAAGARRRLPSSLACARRCSDWSRQPASRNPQKSAAGLFAQNRIRALSRSCFARRKETKRALVETASNGFVSQYEWRQRRAPSQYMVEYSPIAREALIFYVRNKPKFANLAAIKFIALEIIQDNLTLLHIRNTQDGYRSTVVAILPRHAIPYVGNQVALRTRFHCNPLSGAAATPA